MRTWIGPVRDLVDSLVDDHGHEHAVVWQTIFGYGWMAYGDGEARGGFADNVNDARIQAEDRLERLVSP